ncbi:hypothetical protein ACLFMI_00975 [Pseudonocardia nantongensis]|uniref:hypothetical protein n=1 Tax=Pseudonocardia nantongensis TaxID=1181885 RepID=UPI0039786FA5
MSRPSRRRIALSLAAAGFMAFWIIGTAATILAGGERGADDDAALLARAEAALRAGDGARLHELLLDAPDRDFTDDYAERLRAAGDPVLTRTGPDALEIRSGPRLATLSVTEENGRWYLSLLPAEG